MLENEIQPQFFYTDMDVLIYAKAQQSRRNSNKQDNPELEGVLLSIHFGVLCPFPKTGISS